MGQGAARIVGGARANGCAAADCGAGAQIRAFQPVEYWTLEAQLHPEKQVDQKFKAKFIGIGSEPARVANGTDKDVSTAHLKRAAPEETNG